MSLGKWTEILKAVPDRQLREVVVESWERSISAGIEFGSESFIVPRISNADLQRRITTNAGLLEVAIPHIEWLSASLSGIPHVVYVVDSDGIVLHALSLEVDLAANFLSPGHDWSEKAAGTNGAGTAIAANRPVAIIGSEHIVKPFHRFTCTGAPVHDASGKVIGAIDVSTGVDDGNPERLLAVAHAAFVIDRELAQRAALYTAQAATAARDRLLAEVSHELRTPLAVILGWAQFLRDDPSALEEAVDAIESSAWTLSLLIGDLVEMSRIATGKLRLNRRLLDLSSVVNAVVKTMKPIASRKGVSLDIKATERATISADAKRIEQVLANLLANAIKFTAAGGSIALSVRRSSDTVRITVSDTGCGIDDRILSHIFDYLRQGVPGEQAGGLGLGLAIVREIVERHGGNVRADSDGPGRGACFTVDLPLYRSPSEN